MTAALFPHANRRKLVLYLNRALNEQNSAGTCSVIRLRHALIGDKAEPVREWHVAGVSDGDELASQIIEAAYDDACGLESGPQRYALRAYYGKDEPRSGGMERHPFTMRAGQDVENSEMTSYPETEKGVLALTIRHQQETFRIFSSVIGETFRQTILSNEMMSRRLEGSEKVAMELHETLGRLLRAEAESRVDMEIKIRDSKRKDEAMLMLAPAVPAIINALAGKEVLPEPGSPHVKVMDGFKSLLGSLTPDQFEKLFTTFTPEQAQEFMALTKRLKDADEAKAKAEADSKKLIEESKK